VRRPGVTVRARAAHDLTQYAAWLRREAGLDIARRFTRVAADSFDRLAEMPGLGSPVKAQVPDLRRWRVPGFPVLIFYRPERDGVAIVRVLHAARDWPALVDDA
jgi:toxin ParE1/3/4